MRRRLALGQAADPVGQDDAALGGRRRHRALLLHRHGGVALDPGDDPAAGRGQVRPPAVIVVAEVEDVGGAGLDRHRLGGRQVGDAGRRHRGADRLAGVGIVDDVSLGAAHRGRKARPPPAQRAEPDAGRVDQVGGFLDMPAQAAMDLRPDHVQQVAEQRGRAIAVGLGQRRAPDRITAQLRQPLLVALEILDDGPQARRPRQLPVHHRHQLGLAVQTARGVIRAMGLD